MSGNYLTDKDLQTYPSAVATAFGVRLREARDRAGLTQEALAKLMKLRRQANISAWEKRVTPPKPETVVDLAHAIGCAPSELLEDVETDYDRLRNDQSISREIPRKIAVGESPPVRHRTVRGKRAHSR